MCEASFSLPEGVISPTSVNRDSWLSKKQVPVPPLSTARPLLVFRLPQSLLTNTSLNTSKPPVQSPGLPCPPPLSVHVTQLFSPWSVPAPLPSLACSLWPGPTLAMFSPLLSLSALDSADASGCSLSPSLNKTLIFPSNSHVGSVFIAAPHITHIYLVPKPSDTHETTVFPFHSIYTEPKGYVVSVRMLAFTNR